MDYGIIYKLTNTVTGKSYVGQTVQGMSVRWRKHCEVALRIPKTLLHQSIAKHGTSCWDIEVLETKVPVEDLDTKEEEWIEKLNTYYEGYNLSFGGHTSRGYKHSEETIAKLRAASSGENAYFYGKKRPDHSALMKGSGNPFFGKDQTEEVKEILRANKLGKKNPEHSEFMRGENNPMHGCPPYKNPSADMEKWKHAQACYEWWVARKDKSYGSGPVSMNKFFPISKRVAESMIMHFKKGWIPELDEEYQLTLKGQN